jgi:mannose-binding lectin
MIMSIYAQTSGKQSTNSGSFVPIPGLSITIPEGVGASALIILNLPMPYATGNDYPGGNVGISVNGTVSSVVGGFTYGVQTPASFNRMPTTLVVNVPLANKAQTVAAVWSGVRGSTVIIDTPATLSAILD